MSQLLRMYETNNAISIWRWLSMKMSAIGKHGGCYAEIDDCVMITERCLVIE